MEILLATIPIYLGIKQNGVIIVQRRQPVWKFLVEYPLHFVHILLTDQAVIRVRGRFYIRLIRCAVCTQRGRNEDIGINQNTYAFSSSFLNSLTSAMTSFSVVRPVFLFLRPFSAIFSGPV